ncbi:hypothetical protein ACWIID_43500 [Streptomyces phaeochromogenes]
MSIDALLDREEAARAFIDTGPGAPSGTIGRPPPAVHGSRSPECLGPPMIR